MERIVQSVVRIEVPERQPVDRAAWLKIFRTYALAPASQLDERVARPDCAQSLSEQLDPEHTTHRHQVAGLIHGNDMDFEADRIRDAGFDNFTRICETGDEEENADALARFLSVTQATAMQITQSGDLFSN